MEFEYKLKEKLETLLQEAMRDADISSALGELSISEEQFLKEMKNREEQFLQESSTFVREIEDFANNRNVGNSGTEYKQITEHPLAQISLFLVVGMGILAATYYWLPQYVSWISEWWGRVLSLIITMAPASVTSFRFWQNNQEKEYRIKIALEEKTKLADSQVLDSVIRPFMRVYINEQRKVSYATTLQAKPAPGIWATMGASFEVPTQTKEKIERFLRNLSGGSIGIAGPRGVGKSTLLESICGKANKDFHGTPALKVLVTVPVKYEARDFILHLFCRVCEEVKHLEEQNLNSAGTKVGNRNRIMEASKKTMFGFWSLFLNLFPLFIAVVVLGASGTIFSWQWALQINSQINPTKATDDFWQVLGSTGGKPIDMLLPSILVLSIPVLLGITLALAAYFRFFFQFLLTVPKILNRSRTQRQSAERLPRQDIEDSQARFESAESHLAEIKFQETLSSSWSGSIKMPESIQLLESSSEYTHTQSRNQKTLPEIVGEYCDFIDSMATTYKVLIGIDELDKIASSEIAQQFLNETKAIFGRKNCFFLISVSDNALSNFERRGIAFRDEFDTAFDTVLFLDTPSIDYAIQLLQRRVIGMPLPFAYLCYVVSGGLPRDLIRVSREVFDIAQTQQTLVSLEMVTREIVRSDLRSKIRAISIAANQNLVEPEASRLFNAINKIDLDLPDSWLTTVMDMETDPLKSETKMRKLIDELATYLTFSATVLNCFQRMQTTSTNKALDAREIKQLEQLAKAKQLITSSPAYAKLLIEEFQNCFGISQVTAPSIS